MIKPKLILLLGKVAADTLLHLNQPLNKMRGKVHFYNGIKTMVTFHPAALLRNPNWKRPTWEDMQEFKKLYEELKSKKN
jgi:DNA polymerase